jgi:hypothetical protein
MLTSAAPTGSTRYWRLFPKLERRIRRSDTLGTVFADFGIGEDSKAIWNRAGRERGQIYRRLPLGADNNVLLRVNGSFRTTRAFFEARCGGGRPFGGC